MTYDTNELEILLCPRCMEGSLKQNNQQLTCLSCNETFFIVDNIPILLKDIKAKTKLEKIDYDAMYQIDEKYCRQLYQNWVNRVFDRYKIKNGRLLEIGCGTGSFTHGLVNNSRFSKVHAIDISPTFLSVARKRVGDSINNVKYYACDANYLPFQANSFDIIVGSAVLHHFIDYPDTLRQCKRLLSENGYAVFFEPVIQGKVMVAFIIDLMMRIERACSLNVFSEVDIENMNKVVRHQVKIPKMKHDRAKLKHIEDKYIFDLEEMKKLSSEIGFSRFDYIQANDQRPRNFKPNVIASLAKFGISSKKISQYDFLFESIVASYSDILGDSIVSPMVYFVFQR